MSPAHAFQRILKQACCYGGDFHAEFYNAHKDSANGIAAVADLQALGVKFTLPVARHWMFELLGTFEVTHPRYKPPEHVDSAPAEELFAFFLNAQGYVLDPATGEWNEPC